MSVVDAVLTHVRERAGLYFPGGRLGDAETGVARAMAALAISDAPAYLARVRASDGAFDDLVTELTVGETYFCRDAHQFAALRTEILPEILERQGAGHAIRTWSAGCASGEEAYSLAALFLEERLRSSILATDISPRSLVKARAASYGGWSLRGTSAAFRERYFHTLGNRFVLKDEIRRMVRFEALNLASDTYPSRTGDTANFDLILCRNVLIYFGAGTIRDVGHRLMRALAPGGWLLLGASDPALDCIAGVQRLTLAWGIAYRRSGLSTTNAIHETNARIEAPVPIGVIARKPELPQRTTPAVTHAEPRTATVVETAIRQLRRAADSGRSPQVMELAGEMIDRFPLSAELHFLRAVLLLDFGSDDAAMTALRRALFLDRSLAAAHFTLGALLRRRGNEAAAERSFLNAIAAADCTGDPCTALGDGTSPEEIRMAAEIALSGIAAEGRP